MNSRDSKNRRRGEIDFEESDAQLPYRWWPSKPTKGAILIAVGALAIFSYIMSQMWLYGGAKKEDKPVLHASKSDQQFHRSEPAAQPTTTISFPPATATPSLDGPALGQSRPPSGSALFAFASGDDPNAGYSKKAGAAAHEGENGQMIAGEDDALSASLRASPTGKTARAHILKNARLTVTEGTQIPCVLKTRVDTTLTGFVVCESRDEVRGPVSEGGVMLLPKWTRFTGQIRRSLNQYEDRVSIVWVKALTSDKPPIEIDINSPATDMLGAPGVDAQVDNHIPEKIGAVLMYTVIEAGPQLAVQALQNQSNTGSFSPYSFSSAYQPSQTVAGELLRQKMMRPPVAIKNQGEELMVFVAQNWDLSDVIELQAKR